MTRRRDCQDIKKSIVVAQDICPGGIASYAESCYEEPCWIVIQSRGQFGNPIKYFYRGWEEYANGFGEPGMFPTGNLNMSDV